MQLLDLAEQGSGVRIFIGSENKLFSLSGSSLVVAPYRDKDSRVVGALGVIGPTRLNYARIVPMVDYTAQMVELLQCWAVGSRAVDRSRSRAGSGIHRNRRPLPARHCPIPYCPRSALIFPARTSISGGNPERPNLNEMTDTR